MKCPKCSYVSFEFLNTCKKCGSDLSLHKTELGIDFLHYQSLGISAFLREENSTPTAIVEEAQADGQLAETGSTGGFAFEGQSGKEAGISAETDFESLGAGIDISSHDEIDLSGLGESADETALIGLPHIEEKLDLSEKEETGTAAPSDNLEGIEFDLDKLDMGASGKETQTTAPQPKEEALDLGNEDLDLGMTGETTKPAAEIKKEEGMELDLSDHEAGALGKEARRVKPKSEDAAPDFDIGDLEVSLIDETEKPAGEKEEVFDLSGIDLDLGDVEENPQMEPSSENPDTTGMSQTEAFDALGTTGATPIQQDSSAINLDSLDLGIDYLEPNGDVVKAGTTQTTKGEVSLDGLDLDINLDELDILATDKEDKKKDKEGKKTGPKPEDDLDIDLSDLKLE